MRCGVDTGGTFTDVVADDGRIAKVPSTPDDSAAAVATGLDLLAPDRDLLAHGTTVATNALLERRGAIVALITTAGFADVIEIARQDRPSLYDASVRRPQPLVTRANRLELTERLAADGSVLTPVGSVPAIPEGVGAVAVCLLHSDRNPAHERAVADELRARGVDVTCSHEVSPEFREYERTVTTVMNAYLRPACRGYLRSLDGLARDVLVLTSAGGLLSAHDAAEVPAALLLSGPAGGVRAGATAAAAAGFRDCVTFDMGGTSTDVCLVLGGVPEPAPQREVAGLPVRMPSLDIHTIGAGGGSVAWLDGGGALRVGPRSAGAVPGPACYSRGGTEPTVTDADLVLGRIPADTAFSGLGVLDGRAADDALTRVGVAAAGVVAVVDAAMEEAVRAVTVSRGVDPRHLALVAFGGAGPLHACAIAEALDMDAVVVPPRAGVLSAVGLLGSPRQRDVVRSWTGGDLAAAQAELAAQVTQLVGGSDAEVTTSLDCRYPGQSHELTVPAVDAFHDEHERRNGFARRDADVEVIAVRARARRPAPVDIENLPPPVDAARHGRVNGPSVIAEPDCTVWVPDGWHAEVGGGGAWILRRSRS